ncbi:MAG: hypothetical protein ACYSYV_01920 [Planctomycetota bacterium]|jgi:hypothetical protein
MTVEGLMERVSHYSSWLYYERNWGRWEPAIAITAVLFLILIAIARRRARVKVRQLRERSPIVGLRLAARRGMRIRKSHWRECSLIVMIMFLSLFLVAMRMLNQDGTPTAISANEAVTKGVMQANALSRGEDAVNTKVDPFYQKYGKSYQKYKNKYALLPVSLVYVELLSFDPEDESSPWIHGHEDADDSLPDWAVGEYGVIPPRRIVQILGPDEMLVAGLISEGGRVVHFKGWPTEGLANGQAWPFDPYGPDPNEERAPAEVAVVGTYRYGTIIGEAATVPSVVPLGLFRKGVTLGQFKDLLLSKAELPEDLQQLKSEMLADETKYSDKQRPAGTRPKWYASSGEK